MRLEARRGPDGPLSFFPVPSPRYARCNPVSRFFALPVGFVSRTGFPPPGCAPSRQFETQLSLRPQLALRPAGLRLPPVLLSH